jgi:hypothetical protein
MELKEFVSETLVQILAGVQDAISRRLAAPGSLGAINPVFGLDAGAAGPDHIQKVEFDVAVTVTDKAGGGGKAGIKVFSIELGGEAGKSTEQSIVSRIKFAVPVIPPVSVVKPAGAGEV